jgi:hypothetical protein
MRRYALLPLLLILTVAASCPGGPPTVDPLTNLSPATATDAGAALSALDSMQQAAHARALAGRKARTVPDAQWQAIVRAENTVRDASIGPNALLSAWSSTGSKPPDFDAALANLHAAVNALVATAP